MASYQCECAGAWLTDKVTFCRARGVRLMILQHCSWWLELRGSPKIVMLGPILLFQVGSSHLRFQLLSLQKIHQGHWRKGPSFVDKYNGWFHKCLCFRTQQQSSKHSGLHLVIHSLWFPGALSVLKDFGMWLPTCLWLDWYQNSWRSLYYLSLDSLPANLISLTSVEDSSQWQQTRVTNSLFQDKWNLYQNGHIWGCQSGKAVEKFKPCKKHFIPMEFN